MSYFSQFPYLLYPSFKGNESEIVKNLSVRVVNFIQQQDRTLFYDYTLLESDTLDSVCINEYNDINYYWTILVYNNIFDINYDLPLNYRQFSDYIIEKYGSESSAMTNYKYFIKPNKYEAEFIEVPESTYTQTPEAIDGVIVRKAQSIYYFEMEKNEAKRKIKLIKPEFIQLFVDTFNSKF